MFQFERQNLMRFLQGMSWPMSRQQLLDKARQSDLPRHLLEVIHKLGERDYQNPQDVIGDLDKRHAA